MSEPLEILRAIAAYIPNYILQQIIAAPYSTWVSREERRDVALLFADISGFTTMSESLAQLGREGAEELTRLLNSYFATMIELVHSHSGQVIKFGGDAMTCAFTDAQETDGATVLQACTCALAMQEEMSKFHAVETRMGSFALQMKIGISAGTVLFFNVGDPREGMEYVLAGCPVEAMVDAEHHATAGEVLVDTRCTTIDKATWQKLGIEISEQRNGFFLLNKVKEEIPRGGDVTREDFDWTALNASVMEEVIARVIPYLPPAIYEQIVDGQRDFVGEHRRVVSLFVNFTGIDYDDPEAGEKLQRYFTTMQKIINRYGGRLNRVITEDKGNMLHVIFGAPVAYEDNEKRGVGCALEMRRKFEEDDELSFISNQRIGIASGYVFAGNVGSDRRREYTVMGDVVNLSARLMQVASNGEILMDERTTNVVEQEFVCQQLQPVQVKGKQELITVCRPLGVREEAKVWGKRAPRDKRQSLPIVGRERELARIVGLIDRAASGRGQLLVINGEAGVGKSRILEELVALARGKGMYGLGGDCLSYGAQMPYLPWVDLFKSFFGLDEHDGRKSEDRISRVRARLLETDPELDKWLPLVAQFLGLPVADNDLTASLDAKLRKQRIFDIALLLIQHQARQAPLFLMVFEDVHWIDNISLELLNHIAGNIADYRVLLVAIHRPTIELPEWRSFDNYNRIELADLTAEGVLALVRAKLGIAKVPEALRDLVLQDERVNPFFLEEMLNSLIEEKYLALEGDSYRVVRDLAEVEIPDNVQALVMSRIDRLDESSKLTVKVASVIGRLFKYKTLKDIYPIDIDDAKLWNNLRKLSSLDLTALDRPAPEWEYIFKHIITQEVAYESLMFAHRRELHHKIAEYFERNYRYELEEYYEILAHHYSRSEDKEKSLDYLVKAGHKARDRYANATAIDYYSRALGTLEQIAENDETNTHNLELKYDIIAAREIVYDVIGDRENQKADIEAMINLAETLTDNLRLSDAYNREAQLYSNIGNYRRAEMIAAKATAIKREIGDKAGEAIALHHIGNCYWHRGDYKQALRYVKQSLQIREALGDKRGEGRELSVLGVVYWTLGHYQEALYYSQKAVKTRQIAGDKSGAGSALNNLGLIYAALGMYEKALTCYQEALQINKDVGFQYEQALLLGNLGTTYYYLHKYEHARTCHQEALTLASKLEAIYMMVESMNELARIHRDEPRGKKLHVALQYAVEATELAREAALVNGEIWGLTHQGIIYLLQGDYTTALRCSRQAVALLEGQEGLEGSEEEIYFNHFRVLRVNGLEAEARVYIRKARDGVIRKKEKITDAVLRHSFVEQVRVHREILEAWNNESSVD